MLVVSIAPRGVIAALLLCVSASLAPAQATALKLVGLDGATKELAVTELQALPQVDVTDSSAATGRVIFRGPALRALVSLVGAPEGRSLRGPAMLLAIIAEASDGYSVAYSLAELDPQFGGRGAIVALTQNGQALSATDGPLRIVIPGEMHRARWIRQLTTLRVVRAGAPARAGGLTTD